MQALAVAVPLDFGSNQAGPYTRAAATLKRSEQELRRVVTQLGTKLGSPWRADEKVAALAAWLALAGRTSV